MEAITYTNRYNIPVRGLSADINRLRRSQQGSDDLRKVFYCMTRRPAVENKPLPYRIRTGIGRLGARMSMFTCMKTRGNARKMMPGSARWNLAQSFGLWLSPPQPFASLLSDSVEHSVLFLFLPARALIGSWIHSGLIIEFVVVGIRCPKC